MNKTILYVLMALILVFSVAAVPVFTEAPADEEISFGQVYTSTFRFEESSTGVLMMIPSGDVPATMSFSQECEDTNNDNVCDDDNGNGYADAITGTITWDPGNYDNDIYVITLNAWDMEGGYTSHTFTLMPIGLVIEPIFPIQDTNPAFTSTPITTAEVGVLYEYDADAVDLDGNNGIPLQYSLTLSPATMTIDVDGLIQWTPNATGNEDVVVEVEDDDGNTATQSFTITVTEQPVQNTAPTIDSIPDDSVEANQTWTYTNVTANDVDVNDTLTFSVSTSPASGLTIDSATGEMTWTPVEGEEGNYTVTVTVEDGNGGNASTDFNLEVTAIPEEPATCELTITNVDFTPADLVVEAGTDVNATVTVETCENTTAMSFGMSVVYSENPLSMSFTMGLDFGPVSPGANTYDMSLSIPDDKEAGDYPLYVSFGASMADNSTTNTTSEYLITITEATNQTGNETQNNTAPVLDAIADQEATENVEFTYTATASDDDNDTLSFSLATYPSGMTIDSATGVITWTPGASAIGDNSVTVSVTDGTDSDTESFTITVSEMTELDQVGLDLDELEDDINGLEDNLDTLESDVEDAWEEYEDAEDDGDDDDMDDAQDDLDDLEDDLDDYEDDLDELQDRLDDLEDDLDDITKTVSNEDQYEDYEDQIDELQEDIDDLVDFIAELYDLIDDGELDSDSGSSSSSSDTGSSTTYTPTYTYTSDDEDEDVEVVTTPSNYVPYQDTASTVTEDKNDTSEYLVIALLAALVLLGAVGVFLMLVILFKK